MAVELFIAVFLVCCGVVVLFVCVVLCKVLLCVSCVGVVVW